MKDRTRQELRAVSLAGRQARLEGIALVQNPYLLPGPYRDSELAAYWEAGWMGTDLELSHGASKEDVRDQRFLPRS